MLTVLRLDSDDRWFLDNAAQGGLTSTGAAYGGFGVVEGGSAVSGASGSANGGSVYNSAGYIVNGYGASEYRFLSIS